MIRTPLATNAASLAIAGAANAQAPIEGPEPHAQPAAAQDEVSR